MSAGDAYAFELMRVASVQRETADTVTLALDGGFRFEPGQFNMLSAFGAGEVPISISGDTGDHGRLVHTVRAVGGATRALCRLAPGDALGVRGPYGTAWPVSAAEGKDLLVVAGGIGLAPLRPVVYRALRERSRFRRVSLLYGARTPGDRLYAAELDAWVAGDRLHCDVIVDRGDPGWNGHTGVVTKLTDEVELDPARTLAMICGPEIMMRFTARGLVSRGVAETDIYVSAERNMKCGVGLCGHCQLGHLLLCRDGPVLDYAGMKPLMTVKEL
jgi:NAD(P)H-flavin reductase